MAEPAPDGRIRALETLTEDELLAAVRAGDTGAYAVLYRRHRHEALRLARSLGGSHDPDDVAQEAFLKTLKSILRGGGPRRGFAPYLMRVVRNEAIDRARRTHEDAVDDLERVMPDRFTAPDGVDELFDRQLVRTAFEKLPEAWQRILWLTEVEGETPRALAPQLGRSPNAIAQLSRRAREGLRAAWLQAHLDTSDAAPACRNVAQDLDAHEHGRLAPARSAAVASHLEICARCAAARDELRGLAVQLRSVLLPLVLGSPLLLERLSADVVAVGPSADGTLAPRNPLASLDAVGGSGVLRGALASHAGAFVTLGAIVVLAVGSGLLLGSVQDAPSVFGVTTSSTPQQEGSADAADGTGAAAGGDGGVQGGDGAATGGDGPEEAAAASSSTSTATGAAAGGGTASPVQIPVAAPGGPDETSSTSPSTSTSDDADPAAPSPSASTSDESDSAAPPASGSTPVPADERATAPTPPRQGSSPDAPEEPTPQTPTSPSDPATDPAKDKQDPPRPTWPGQPMSPPSPGRPSPPPSPDPSTDPASPAGPSADPNTGDGATEDGTAGESDGDSGGTGDGPGGDAGAVISPSLPRPGADPSGPQLPPAAEAPTESAEF